MNFDRTSKVIDLGCGQGKPSLHFAIAVNPCFNVGIEIVPWRWYQAILNLSKASDSSLIGNLPYPDCYFELGNIRDVQTFDPFTHVYMFSTGYVSNFIRHLSIF